LAQLLSVQLVVLQKRHDFEFSIADGSIFDPGPDVDEKAGAFMDTAAIMSNMDLVISSDTAVPHVAGALGVPIWVALPHVPDWRWLLNRSDSPWYPTMRLFRQPSLGDWDTVFEQLAAALRQQYGL
jgi:hypothetical protein